MPNPISKIATVRTIILWRTVFFIVSWLVGHFAMAHFAIRPAAALIYSVGLLEQVRGAA
jgi:hypothetical protein